jgi:hypothetical protein
MEPIDLGLIALVIWGVKILDRHAKKLARSNNRLTRALGHDVEDACASVEEVADKA